MTPCLRWELSLKLIRRNAEQKNNYVFLGEAGSGKSEIALNYAMALAEVGDREVHFFDMDMTKPLFRSRSVLEEMEDRGIIFHYEDQFMDAPTLVGGVRRHLRDDDCYVVMDVGGDYIGARAIGGFAPDLNGETTGVYYVLNSYRPWSYDLDHIDHTLVDILGVSHVSLDNVSMVNNPNIGPETSLEDFLAGCDKMDEMVKPYKDIEFACVSEHLYEEAKDRVEGQLMPLRLFLKYPWL